MKTVHRFAAGLAAGLMLGWLWGLTEGAGHVVVHLVKSVVRSGALPPFSLLDLAAILLLAAALYGLVLAPLCGLGTALLGGLLRRLPGKLALAGPWSAASCTALFGVFFFSLYWWTRPVLFYGLRFHDPRRIAAAGVFALVAFAGALICVRVFGRLGTRLIHRPKILTACLVFAFIAAGVLELRERSIALGGPPPADAGEGVNVVLLVPDALRADHLGPYGYNPYDRPVTPFLDRLAGESVVFEQAVTQAPYTWTSFGSFLTGKFPRKHGLLKMDPTQRLDPKDNVTLAEILNNAGYTCGAFLMGTLSNNSGLLQGFDVYFEALVGHDPVSIHSKWSIFKSDLVLMRLYNKIKQARDPALVNTLACRFIREMKDRPFFLMIHYYATHTPYDPPEPYKSMYDADYEGQFEVFTQGHNFAVMDGRLPLTERDLKRIVSLYDGGVTFQDAMFSELYATLEAEGLLDRTLLILTSDHGEELYDHKVFEHDWMYNTNQLVPLMIRFPGGRYGGRRVSQPVCLIDLVPTVGEVAGITLSEAVAREVDGKSLVPLASTEAVEATDPVYAFCENNRYISVQDEAFKLIRYRWKDRVEPDRLFHIAEDPGETLNVIDRYPEAFKRLSQVLAAYDQSMPKQSKTYQSDPALYKRLFELGYIQGNLPQLEGDLERR